MIFDARDGTTQGSKHRLLTHLLTIAHKIKHLGVSKTTINRDPR